MKKFNLREKHIHMGAFDFSVVVVFGDYKEACKFVLWKFDDKGTNLEALDKGHIPRGECLFRRGYIPIIWLPRKPKTAREHATLAHEALHAVWHMFEWASIPTNRDTEEVMAHSMAHIITNALK